jgi:hypothetical protein
VSIWLLKYKYDFIDFIKEIKFLTIYSMNKINL